MTTDHLERLRGALLEALAPLAQALERLLERFEAVLLRATLRVRYGVTVGVCDLPICLDRGTVVASSSRRLSAAQVLEVRRLTARLRRAERRSNGEREASA